MNQIKRILFLILAVATAWMIFNFDYFRKNVEFELQGEKPTRQISVRENMEPDMLIVPSLNISVPVKYAPEANEDKFQTLLIDGVVHYPGTAKIGEVGNVYIFGHSSDNVWSKGHYKTVFALLPKMQVGQKIYISNSQGEKFVYQVIETRVVAKDDLSVLSQETEGRRLLTLQTSYPVGTSLKRYVVVAKLAE